MGFFGTSNTLQADIEKATSDQNTSEKWGVIMDVVDKIGSSSANAKECLKILIKRLNHADPHVNMQAITLLDACVNNCGKNFHLEIASREFETEFKKLITKSQPQVITRLKQCLKRWAENDFKTDPQLNLIPTLYQQLKSKGHEFTDPQTTSSKKTEVYSKDPNVVSSQQEEDDIAKAIELSLKEKTHSPKSTASSLYPSVNSSLPSAAPIQEPRKVRALYDFEAAEENELTFKAGEVIMVLEDSDPNWWKGSNSRGEGLFPSNFVTADLSAEPERLDSHKGGGSSSSGTTKKTVQFEDAQNNDQKEEAAEINEDGIDRLLFLLHEADPEDPSQDSKEMLRLEHTVNQMGPLIDMELERVDRKHAQLTQLSSDLVEAINLYHSLMRDSDVVMSSPYMRAGGFPGMPPQQFNNMYANMYHPQMPQGNMSMPGMPPHHMQAGPPSMGQFPPNSMSAFVPPSSAPGFMPPSSMPGGFPVTAAQQSQMQGVPGPNQNMPNGNTLPNNSQFQPPPQQIPPGAQQPTQNQPPMGNPQQQIPQMGNMIGHNQMHNPMQHQTQPGMPGSNNFPTQLPNQMMNGGQQNFPQQMNAPQPPTSQPLNHMMGNLTINPGMNQGMHHHPQIQQLPPQHHPVTYIQQNDANQNNIPIYQQQR